MRKPALSIRRDTKRVSGGAWIAVAILSGAIISAPAFASEYTETGKIDSAVVFRDRAMVKRSVKVEFEQGYHLLTISGVPANADERTARITGTSNTGMTITGVRFVPVELSKSADPKEAAIAEKIEKLQRDIKKLDYKINARKEQIDFIDRLTGADKKTAAPIPLHKPALQDLEKLMDFIYARSSEAGAAIFDAQAEQDRIKKEIERLQREMSHLKARQSKGYKNVVVEFKTDGKGKGTFNAELSVPDAGWEPVYAVRADTAKNEIRVSFSALVRQRTGEDWDGVRLTLSTAAPEAGMSAPEIKPWIVSPFYPVRARGFAAQSMAPAPAPAAGADMAMMKTEQEPLEEIAAVDELATAESDVAATSFDAPGRAVVKSGGEKTRISVAELAFKGEWSFFTAPRLSPKVYLRGKFTNTTQTPLPAGSAMAFAGDSFAGMGRLKQVSPGQEATLDFGVDELVTVERKLVKKETGREGVVTKKNSVRYIYETVIESHKPSPVTLEMKDHLPLPSDEAIKIVDVTLKPQPDKRDERNILTWSLPLEPNAKKTVRMEFSVEYPREMEITGLFE